MSWLFDVYLCGKQVQKLSELFQESFKYSTEIVELSTTSKPQLQLNCAIMNFVHRFNGPHNLLIIYYTGHGSYDNHEDKLELHAYVRPSHQTSSLYQKLTNHSVRSDVQSEVTDDNYPAKAYWNIAERPLFEDSECDILAILDCCFASNLQKNSQETYPRTYELLTASGYGRVTAGPGRHSFTTALISSLKDLLKENGERRFNIRQVCEKINIHPERRHNPSHVWSRLKTYDHHITLAPLNSSTAVVMEDCNPNKTCAFLRLRLPLTIELDNLTEKEIGKIAEAFSKAVKDIKAPIKRIDWWGLQVSGQVFSFPNAIKAIIPAVRWKRAVGAVQPLQSSVVTVDQTVQTADGAYAQKIDGSSSFHSTQGKTATLPLSPLITPRKRKNGERDHEASDPQSKRKLFDSYESCQDASPDLGLLTPQSTTKQDIEQHGGTI